MKEMKREMINILRAQQAVKHGTGCDVKADTLDESEVQLGGAYDNLLKDDHHPASLASRKC